MKIQVHQALGLDYIEIGNTIRAEDECKNIINLDSKNIWALTMLKNIAIDKNKQLKEIDNVYIPINIDNIDTNIVLFSFSLLTKKFIDIA